MYLSMTESEIEANKAVRSGQIALTVGYPADILTRF